MRTLRAFQLVVVHAVTSDKPVRLSIFIPSIYPHIQAYALRITSTSFHLFIPQAYTTEKSLEGSPPHLAVLAKPLRDFAYQQRPKMPSSASAWGTHQHHTTTPRGIRKTAARFCVPLRQKMPSSASAWGIFLLAVAAGFEPAVRGYRTQHFECCTFGRSDTLPLAIVSAIAQNGKYTHAPYMGTAITSSVTRLRILKNPQNLPANFPA